jgi:hypothetical protein
MSIQFIISTVSKFSVKSEMTLPRILLHITMMAARPGSGYVQSVSMKESKANSSGVCARPCAVMEMPGHSNCSDYFVVYREMERNHHALSPLLLFGKHNVISVIYTSLPCRVCEKIPTGHANLIRPRTGVLTDAFSDHRVLWRSWPL